ncbi:MAG: hypothetical protein AAF998_27130, partial [Bacteroidota bacterium]
MKNFQLLDFRLVRPERTPFNYKPPKQDSPRRHAGSRAVKDLTLKTSNGQRGFLSLARLKLARYGLEINQLIILLCPLEVFKV